MTKRFLLALFLACCTLSTNAQHKMTPLEFNDQLATITDTLFALGTSWGTKFGEVYQTKKFSELAPIRKRFDQFLTKQIALVKNMKDVGESKDLRLGMVTFLLFEKKMATELFVPIDQLGEHPTDEQIQTVVEKLTAGSKQEAIELEKFGVLQETYASKNGFTIEAKKEQ